MPRVTKAMLEDTNAYLRRTLDTQASRVKNLEGEVSDLKNIVSIYQGMSSFTIASERIVMALDHTLGELRKPIRKY